MRLKIIDSTVNNLRFYAKKIPAAPQDFIGLARLVISVSKGKLRMILVTTTVWDPPDLASTRVPNHESKSHVMHNNNPSQ
ncbi:hypothetical protein F2Q69_00031348 [Brassica cretica]|uniref:Uncharacterized protein n=1 Tax=Brassica cretica TaxID=69181 RepID=A0A8S9RSF5_BRACR|nr:hypothetical protein F2Q69_00031348 [Brassica cretica]